MHTQVKVKAYFLCLEDLSINVNAQQRIKFNCKHLNYNIIPKSIVFTPSTNDILIVSRTSRVFFLKNSNELKNKLMTHKNISLIIPANSLAVDIIIVHGKLITTIIRQIRQLSNYFTDTWNSFVREISRLHNSQLLVDNDGIFISPISHSKDIKLDFYGLCNKANRSYPMIIYTNCVQDFGQCELLLTKFVYPIAPNQYRTNISENNLFRESFPFFCFFCFFIVIHLISKLYKL